MNPLNPEALCFLTFPDPALVQVEAGNRALKAVFGSKLAAKGKSLAELLQPHSIGNFFLSKIAASDQNIESNFRSIYKHILCNTCKV